MSKVSIIIPCYKQAHLLPETLDSVLAQTHGDWECIVVNDGSPDNTAEVAERYASQDARIRHVWQENKGLSGARNRGLDEAGGAWIQFLDSDDILHPDKLTRQLDAMRPATRPAMSFCDYRYIVAEGSEERVAKSRALNLERPRLHDANPLLEFARRWEIDLSIPAHSFLFDARLFTKLALRFDTKLPNHEDWECWMRVLAEDPEIYPVQEELALYRVHGSSMCTNQDAMWRGYALALLKQMRLHRWDWPLHATLRRKYVQMRTFYLGPPEPLSGTVKRYFRLGQQGLGRAYRKTVPWPIQRLIRDKVQNRQ